MLQEWHQWQEWRIRQHQADRLPLSRCRRRHQHLRLLRLLQRHHPHQQQLQEARLWLPLRQQWPGSVMKQVTEEELLQRRAHRSREELRLWNLSRAT